MRERIRGYADAAVEDASDRLADLTSELEAVRGALGASDDLRTAMADPVVAAHSRRAVLDDLLAQRVMPTTLGLLDYCIDADRATALPEDVAWLAARTAAARDGLVPAGSGVLGHHAAAERVDGYASPVLAAVRERDGLGELEDQLFRFERIVSGNEELHAALTSRDLPPEARAGVITDLLEAKSDPASVRLAVYATRVGRPRDYPALLRALVARVAAEAARRVAEVRAVVPLDGGQRDRIAAAIGRIVGQAVQVRAVVDPSVLGGFVATVGDTVVDASTRHRIDVLKERLASPETAPSSTSQGAQS